jgi:CRISPR-associated protein Cmr1
MDINMKMELIQADFGIVTPMFLGEADGQCASKIRPPAIKGALRFWWRALNWAPIRQSQSADADALLELHKQEAALFGSSAQTGSDGKTQTGGQGMFLLRVSEQKISKGSKSDNCLTSAPLQYLAGMGLYHFRDGLLRSYLKSGGSFTLQLALKSKITENQKKQLTQAITCFGLLGCLGSRARKGFGSVSLAKLVVAGNEQPLPQSADDYQACLAQLLGPCLALKEEPPFTAFSALSRVQIGGQGKSAIGLLRDHGYEMGMYRGYGKNGKTFGKPAKQNFKSDHDWAYAVADGKSQADLPKRAVFGLPHPYFLSSINKSVAVDVDKGNGRRASPLFAHIHQLPSGDCLLTHLVLRSRFMPSSMMINVTGPEKAKKSENGLHFEKVSAGIDWKVLDDFLKCFNPTDKDIIHGR